jgi:hypothetical protein
MQKDENLISLLLANIGKVDGASLNGCTPEKCYPEMISNPNHI